MIQVIGGQDKLYALISALLEKHVYEYKIKKYNKTQNPQTAELPASQEPEEDLYRTAYRSL